MKEQFLKKSILLFFTISMLSNTSHAQNKFGLYGGVNITYGAFTERFQEAFASDPALNLHAGIAGNFSVSQKFSFGTRLSLSFQGWKLREVFFNSQTDSKAQLSYLELQVSGNIHIIERLVLMVGGEFGYLVNAKLKTNLGTFDDDYKKADIGILGGLEFRIIGPLAVYAKYIHGLTELRTLLVTDANGQPLGITDQGKNRNIQIGVLYYFI